MYRYVITPIDILMLGEPAPFNSAEQTYRKSSTILNPIPFFAFLRKERKDVKISFISFIKNGEFFFPLPFDVVEVNGKCKFGKLVKSKTHFLSDSHDDYLIKFGDGKLKTIDEYVDSHWLEKYLLCEEKLLIDQRGMLNTHRLFDSEYRVGIKINRERRTTEQGFLYFENYLRFNDMKQTGFYIKINHSISYKTVNIGGESRMTQIEEVSRDIDGEFVNQDKIKDKIKAKKLFKIILLTPTNSPCEIADAKLIAKIVRRTYVYSGWLRKGKKAFPSRLFRLIKPGAVFYYKIETKDVDDFIEKLFDKFWLKPSFFKPDFPYFESIEDTNPICLGLTIIGTVKEDKDE